MSKNGALRSRAVAGVGNTVIRALLSTVRFQVSGAEHYQQLLRAGQPVIYVLWHGRLLPLTYLHRGQEIVGLISQNRDGEYIARVIQSWGYDTVRGSSSRGGMAALRQLVRRLREGRSVAITPDGPRGPRQQMKPGALIVAQLSGAPLIPLAGAATRGWWFGRWDRFLVPKPFSRVRVAYGDPIFVPREVDEAGLRAYEAEVQARLDELMRRVDAGV